MAGLNIGDKIAVTMVGECLGQRVQQIMHYDVTTASTIADTLEALLDLANGMIADVVSWPNILRNNAPSNYTWQKLRCQRVWPSRSAFQEVTVNLAGLHAQAATTANVNGVITKRTLVGTRKGIGRMSTAPLASDEYSAGVVTGGTLTGMTTLATVLNDEIVGAVGATTADPVLWSRSTPTTSLLITSAAPQDTVRVMRRRTLRVGI